MKIRLSNILSISVLLITISSINQWSNIPIGNTSFWWIVYILILVTIIVSKKSFFDIDNAKNIQTVIWYLVWNIICIFRGIFQAENYWDWKNLVSTSIVLLLPLTIYISTNKMIVQQMTATWLRYALPGFFLFYMIMRGDAIGHYLIPISFLFLFFPWLPSKWKLITIAISLFVFFGSISSRSNVIKFTVPLLLSVLYVVRPFLNTKLLEIVRLGFCTMPLFLFLLGVTGKFNIFKMDEYISGKYTTKTTIGNGQQWEESLTADTRTFLYEEVLSSAIKFDYVLLGRTPARGNESFAFGNFALEELNIGRMERFSNESSLLNVFTWTGLVGVVLYFLVFYRASYLALHKSNNFAVKVIGLYVSFRWCYAWVEDFSRFDLSYLYLWIMIGMCFSVSFREMNDKEFKVWILGLFSNHYRKYFKKQKLFSTEQKNIDQFQNRVISNYGRI